MKLHIFVIFTLVAATAFGQDTETQTTTSSPAKNLGMFVFPGNNQSAEQQSTDETACFNWARQQTNYDPNNPTKVEAEKADTSLDGSAIRGGARGAAAGAAIGAIAGDAGEGAAIGAIVGGLSGRRSRRVRDQAEQQQNNAEATQAEQKMLDDFKKAFSACMEGKGYTVK